MLNRPMRAAAIHDLSGAGRCSLSVILPSMSVMGVQVCAVPTAVLSTHTGGFGDVARRDLEGFAGEALEHYRRIGLDFECVYTGYLATAGQVAACERFFDSWPQALKVVDPVMGDHGKLYHSVTPELVAGIKHLVGRADLITPNLTEVGILLDETLPSGELTSAQARSLLARLSRLGPSRVIITGVTLCGGAYGNVCYDAQSSSYWKATCEYVPVRYFGTGDLFAAVATAGLLRGDSLPIAAARATRFVELTIKTTYSYSGPAREGVMLEQTLGWLTVNELPRGYASL